MKKFFWLTLISLLITSCGFHSVKADFFDFLAPRIVSVSPSTAFNDGLPIHVTITGSRFNDSTIVKLTRDGFPDIAAANLQITKNTIDCTFDLSDQGVGTWNLIATNSGILGGKPKSDIFTHALTIEFPAPLIDSFFPKDIYFNKKAALIDARVWGSYFREGAKVSMIGPDGQIINPIQIKIPADTQINCKFNLTGKPAGFYKIMVTNDDGKSDILKNFFQIKEVLPELPVVKPRVRHESRSAEPQTPAPTNPAPEPTINPNTNQTPRMIDSSPGAEVSTSPTAALNQKFKPLYFEVNQFNIRDADLPSLENDLTLLKNNPSFIIAISGYADDQKTPSSNLKLSQKRAETVRDFLLANDITAKIIIFSFGKDTQIKTDSAEDQTQNNRRVDVSLWEKEPTKEQVAAIKFS